VDVVCGMMYQLVKKGMGSQLNLILTEEGVVEGDRNGVCVCYNVGVGGCGCLWDVVSVSEGI